jgi:hypothetical protein
MAECACESTAGVIRDPTDAAARTRRKIFSTRADADQLDHARRKQK